MGSTFSQRTNYRPPIGHGGKPLPARPSSICQLCWEGPFAAHLGLFEAPVTDPALQDKDDLTGGYSYWTSWAGLESRAAAGCLWCQFLLALYRKQPIRFKGPIGRMKRFRVTVRRCSDDIATTFGRPVHTKLIRVIIDDTVGFSGYVYAAADNPAGESIVARAPILDIGSPRSLALARSCIAKCVHGHVHCTALSIDALDPRLPSRVIDCTNPGRPRLVSTGGARGRYVALSYVWGEDQPHKTTSANVYAYTDGIDPTCLPKTIRDAIKVTHALGYQFLWIDTLCIVQDSDEDKQHELGRLHDTYRYAFLTIIAASAQKVSQGFLEDRPTPVRSTNLDLFSGDITLPFICPSTTPRLAAGYTVGHTLVPRMGEVHISVLPRAYDYLSEPTSTRAWCLQEYLMSPRSLLFTSETLLFRCQTSTESVGGSFHLSVFEPRLPDVLFYPKASPDQAQSKICSDMREWTQLHLAWLEILVDYTSRKLTNPSDKLVACGAVAAAFQRVLHSDYLAGLWRDTLLDDLLWYNGREGSFLSRPEMYRAPSWSWASVDGGVQVRWRHAWQDSIAKVVKCEVTLKNAELPFGEVSAGFLVLCTALIRVVVRRGEIGGGHPAIYLQTTRQASRWKGHIWVTGEEIEVHTAAPGNLAYIDSVHIDCEADSELKRLWIAPIRRYFELGKNYEVIDGLVVTLASKSPRSAQNVRPRLYHRVGYFSVCETSFVQAGWNTRDMGSVRIRLV
ncbi:heterokaryon incompatibility protein-domain-containing protein [Lenzites betulinus]|nr:heterokaryon incompatibility protein-domain-containing protein [Lenzites betulinus]